MRVRFGTFRQLERELLSRVVEIKRLDPLAPIAIVAPSRRVADRLERLLAVERGLSAIGIRFHTFHSLAVEVVEDAGAAVLPLVADPLFHDRLVDAILENDPSLARRFGGTARPKGLAAALRSSVRDLIDAGVEAREVMGHIGVDWPEGPAASRRLADLLELQERYMAALARLEVSSSSALTVAASRAAAGSALLDGYAEILYYGFYDLTGLQLEFFERVTEARESTFYFPYRKGHPAFKFCDDFFELKLHRGGAAPEPAHGEEDAALSPVLDALFSPERSAEAPEGAVRIYNASGARDEVWRVSKEILRVAEEEGVAFDEIGVVARTLEPYRSAISEVFSADAVPYELAEDEPLLKHPFAKMAQELLTLRRRNFQATAVLDLVESPYLRLPAPFADAKRRRSWSRLIHRLGVSAGWLVWEAKLKRAAGEAESGAAALLDLIDAWRKRLEAHDGRRGWKEWSGVARQLVEDFLALPKDAQAAERAAREAAFAAIDSLAAFDALGAVDWEFFLETLVERLETSGIETPGRRGVRVLNAMDARGESFKVLFLIGLQEGLFPRQVREDPILRDEARARLRHPGGYWIARKGSGHEEERLLFYLSAASARERLYCVFSRSDEDGKAQAPSWYLREICRAARLPLASAERVARQPRERIMRCPPEFLSPQEVALRLSFAGTDASGYMDAVERDGALLRGSPARMRALNARGAAGPLDGIVGPMDELSRRVVARGVSPTGLDSYARCPFQYFAGRVLELEQEEETVDRGEFAASERGRAYHACLERFYGALRESGYWSKPGSSSWRPALKSAADSVFAEYGWREMGVYPLVWEAARTEMVRNLEAFVEWDMARIGETRLVPSYFERELRGTLELPALPASLKGLEFHGFADRIDVDEEGRRFQIVDYKKSPPRKKVEQQVFGGRMHQPPVYAELAPDSLPSGKPWHLEGAHLYALEPSEESGERLFSYSGQQWQRDRSAVLEGIAVSVEEIAQGRFPIRPEDQEFGYCSFCSYSTICRKSHGRSRDRAEAEYENSALKKIHDRKRPKEA
ncbi:MAG: exodeoxyribonuclease V subunit gamma [Elusimicrobia bacterium]|nr:exodeoxyribonuclease V subunit gamma [Elusimicrobiota bacterium]